jgi:hypothetical protein
MLFISFLYNINTFIRIEYRFFMKNESFCEDVIKDAPLLIILYILV